MREQTEDRRWCYAHLRDTYTYAEMALMSDEEMTSLREANNEHEA